MWSPYSQGEVKGLVTTNCQAKPLQILLQPTWGGFVLTEVCGHSGVPHDVNQNRETLTQKLFHRHLRKAFVLLLL